MQKLGIAQGQVSRAPPLRDVLNEFIDWLQAIMHEKGVIMPETDGFYPGRRYMALCTWSQTDLGTFLYNEGYKKGLRVPMVLKYWTDAQKVLRASFYSYYLYHN